MEPKMAHMKVFCAECRHEVLRKVFDKFGNEDFSGDDRWQIVR